MLLSSSSFGNASLMTQKARRNALKEIGLHKMFILYRSHFCIRMFLWRFSHIVMSIPSSSRFALVTAAKAKSTSFTHHDRGRGNRWNIRDVCKDLD